MHALQVDEATVDHVPAAQARQLVLLDAPAREDTVPAEQFKHTMDEVAESVDEYVPALQLVHVELAFADDQVPATQLVHVSDDVAPATGEKVPGAQLRHEAPPGAPKEEL